MRHKHRVKYWIDVPRKWWVPSQHKFISVWDCDGYYAVSIRTIRNIKKALRVFNNCHNGSVLQKVVFTAKGRIIKWDIIKGERDDTNI